eukprot:9871860-Alexandrium_andersonii.AAC.1
MAKCTRHRLEWAMFLASGQAGRVGLPVVGSQLQVSQSHSACKPIFPPSIAPEPRRRKPRRQTEEIGLKIIQFNCLTLRNQGKGKSSTTLRAKYLGAFFSEQGADI